MREVNEKLDDMRASNPAGYSSINEPGKNRDPFFLSDADIEARGGNPEVHTFAWPRRGDHWKQTEGWDRTNQVVSAYNRAMPDSAFIPKDQDNSPYDMGDNICVLVRKDNPLRTRLENDLSARAAELARNQEDEERSTDMEIPEEMNGQEVRAKNVWRGDKATKAAVRRLHAQHATAFGLGQTRGKTADDMYDGKNVKQSVQDQMKRIRTGFRGDVMTQEKRVERMMSSAPKGYNIPATFARSGEDIVKERQSKAAQK